MTENGVGVDGDKGEQFAFLLPVGHDRAQKFIVVTNREGVLGCGGQSVDDIRCGTNTLNNAIEESVCFPGDERAGQVLSAADFIVEGRPANPHFAGDSGHIHSRPTALGNEIARSIEDSVTQKLTDICTKSPWLDHIVSVRMQGRTRPLTL